MTAKGTDAVKKLTMLNQLWKRVIDMNIGPGQNIDLMRLYFIISIECETILVTYPG